MKNKPFLKVIIYLVAGSLLVAGGGFGYWFYQDRLAQKATPAVPSNWKTYTNEKYNFKISYPESWFSNEKEIKASDTITQILWLTTHPNKPNHQTADLGKGDDIRLGINYVVNKSGISLKEELANHVLPDFAINPPEKIESQWINVAGLEAHRYIYYPGNKWGSPGVYATIRLSNGDFVKMIGIILHDFGNHLNNLIDVENSFVINTPATPTSVPVVNSHPSFQPTITKESGKELGYIKRAYQMSSKNYIDIDYIQWLSGEEGKVACKEDGACSATCDQPIDRCLPNGYYIRNQNTKIRTFEVVKNITASLIYPTPDTPYKEVTFEEFMNTFNPENLFRVTVKNGLVTALSQKYVP